MREAETLPKRLRRLRKGRDLSQEGLAYAMHDQGSKGATAGAIGQFERGITRPRPETIEAIAAALGVEPTEFVEYRLALVRRLFDERQVGLEQALDHLESLGDAADALVARVGAESGRRTVAASSNGKRGPRARRRAR
jgi:transcriptional regulator with XRE-family HTH domain